MFILWTLIGFWHGSTWGFVIYGIYHGSIIIISTLLSSVYEKLYKKFPKFVKLKIYGAFQVIRTFCLVLIGYFLFCLGEIKPAVHMFMNSFKTNLDGLKIINDMSVDSKISILVGSIIILVLDILTIKKINIYEKFRGIPSFLRWPIYCVGIFFITMFASGEVQEFLYFKF